LSRHTSSGQLFTANKFREIPHVVHYVVFLLHARYVSNVAKRSIMTSV